MTGMVPVRDGRVPDAALVSKLLREQLPELAELDVRPSDHSGSSNHVFRLGEAWAVRVPRFEEYVDDLLTEARWLPSLAPRLEIPVPEVRFLGEPSALLDRPWTVVTWIPGRPPQRATPAEQARLAAGLGRFMRQLHGLDVAVTDADTLLRSKYRAGEPVTEVIDGWAETAAEGLRDLFEPDQVLEAWRRLRDVPPASGPPSWIHSDLSAENVLVSETGDLAGVVDFGGLSIGDRSVDLLYAWSMFDEPARDVLRGEAEADEATWLRARAWAFVGPGLLTLQHYRDSMPDRAATLTRMVEAVAAEVGVALRSSS